MSRADLAALLNQGYRYALALAHDPHRAEDLLQDAWLGVLQADGPNEKAYLFRAIRSRYLNQKKRDQLVPMVPLESNETINDDTQSPENLLLEIDELEAHLAVLRPVERETFFLFAVEGYTVDEIAQYSGNPRGTVLSLIHRARHKLKSSISSQQEVKHGGY
jgi:RNA polymerase sigma-70 factor (ECF subfamily)